MQLVCVGVVPPWLWEVSASPVQSCAQMQQHFQHLWGASANLVRSPSMPCVIKRLIVILNSEAQFNARRQEGCSLPYLYSAKIPSPYQNLLCSFSRSCGQEVITKTTSPEVRDFCPRNVCASICFPEACLCVKVYKIWRSPKLLYLYLTSLWIVD